MAVAVDRCHGFALQDRGGRDGFVLLRAGGWCWDGGGLGGGCVRRGGAGDEALWHCDGGMLVIVEVSVVGLFEWVWCVDGGDVL